MRLTQTSTNIYEKKHTHFQVYKQKDEQFTSIRTEMVASTWRRPKHKAKVVTEWLDMVKINVLELRRAEGLH